MTHVQPLLKVRIEGGQNAPRRARSALRALNGQLGRSNDDISLMVSELVTNAVSHARAQFVRVAILGLGARVRVEITTPGPAFEAPVDRKPGRDGGFGLFFVDRLAERWGVDRLKDQTCVWFEMNVAPG